MPYVPYAKKSKGYVPYKPKRASVGSGIRFLETPEPKAPGFFRTIGSVLGGKAREAAGRVKKDVVEGIGALKSGEISPLDVAKAYPSGARKVADKLGDLQVKAVTDFAPELIRSPLRFATEAALTVGGQKKRIPFDQLFDKDTAEIVRAIYGREYAEPFQPKSEEIKQIVDVFGGTEKEKKYLPYSFIALGGFLDFYAKPVKEVFQQIAKETSEEAIQTLLKTEIRGLSDDTAKQWAARLKSISNPEAVESFIGKEVHTIGKDIAQVARRQSAPPALQNLAKEAEQYGVKVDLANIGKANNDIDAMVRYLNDKPQEALSSIGYSTKKAPDAMGAVNYGGEADFVSQRLVEIKQEIDNFAKQLKAPAKRVQEIPNLKYKNLDEVAADLRSKDLTMQKLEEIRLFTQFSEEALQNNPARQLAKYVSRTTGTLPEVAGKLFQTSEHNGRRIATSKFGRFGDDIVTELGFKDTNEAIQAFETYRVQRQTLDSIKQELKQVRERVSGIRKGEKLMSLTRKERRASFHALKDRFDLTDADLSKIRNNRDISIMSESEFRSFLSRAEQVAEQIDQRRQARIQLMGTINALELKKWENVMQAMKLPPINKMSAQQMNALNAVLEQYRTGDEFLTTRMLETVHRTELKGIRTIREAQEKLAKITGKSLEEVRSVKTNEFDRYLYDTALARKNPLYEFMVQKKELAFMKTTERVIRLKDEANRLVDLARKSRPRGLADRAVPTDGYIMDWLQANPMGRADLAKKMTAEELQAAEYMDAVYRDYYDYLSQRALDRRFSSRFENQYYPHIRRGMLEAWKDDGFIAAFREAFDQFKNQEKYFNILNEKTGDVLPYEKWVGFSQFRSGELVPTKNSAKAFTAYITALEKARQLDEFIPEMMIYVHSLTPQKLTPRGLELDDSIKRFVKEWVNSKKGRVTQSFVTPGGKIDWALRTGVALTRILDLGFSIPIGIANQFGEQAGNLTMLGARNYAKGARRYATRQGQEIIKRYENFVGESVFKKINEASMDLGDRLLTGMFGLFADASRRGDSVYLLGDLTDEEFKTGIVSLERLANMRIAAGKYRVVEGAGSIMGGTAEGQIIGQYKRWAVPALLSTAENIRVLQNMIKTQGYKQAITSKAGQEIFYSIILSSAVGLGMYGYLSDLGNKKDRTFVENLVYKSSRDALSMIGALNPEFLFSEPRLASFIADLGTAVHDILMLERNKTTGELKGPAELRRAVTPSIIRQLTPEPAPKRSREGGVNTLPGLPGLPALPKLPALPTL